MSIKLMTRVWESSQARGSALLILLALADSANDEGYCWPSLNTIAKKARMERRQVIRVIQSLEAAGEIRVQHRAKDGKKTSNMYWITVKGSDMVTPPMGDSVMEDTIGGVVESPRSDIQDTRVVVVESLKPSFNHHLNHKNEPSFNDDDLPSTTTPMGKLEMAYVKYTKKCIDSSVKAINAYQRMIKAGVIEEDIEAAVEKMDRIEYIIAGPWSLENAALTACRKRNGKKKHDDDTPEARRRYITGEYAEFVEH